MKFPGICILGLAALLCSSAYAESSGTRRASETDEPLRLRLVTYNIRIGAGGGKWDGNPAKINLAPAAKVIAALNPDLIGLEEVDIFRKRSGGMNQVKWLTDKLSVKGVFEPAYTVPTGLGIDEQYGVALLTPHWIHSFERFPLFKPDYSKSHPNLPDYYSEQRVLLHAIASIRGRTVHVFVTHLGLTTDQREQQIRQIAETMARYEGPKILLGDFNAEPASPEMRPLVEKYRDALSETGVKGDQRKSFPVGEKSTEAIDYIFLSTDFHVLDAKVIRDNTLASDHNPVFAEVELPTE